MGWSAWEVFRCTTCEQDPHNCLSEKLIRETTDAMVDHGFRDAGYDIVRQRVLPARMLLHPRPHEMPRIPAARPAARSLALRLFCRSGSTTAGSSSSVMPKAR